MTSGQTESFETAAQLSELLDGQARVVTIRGREIALFRRGEQVYALDNECPHRGGPIGEGRIQGDRVTCPWHEWTFDIPSGVCTLNPAAKVKAYPVRVEEGTVKVALPV